MYAFFVIDLVCYLSCDRLGSVLLPEPVALVLLYGLKSKTLRHSGRVFCCSGQCCICCSCRCPIILRSPWFAAVARVARACVWYTVRVHDCVHLFFDRPRDFRSPRLLLLSPCVCVMVAFAAPMVLGLRGRLHLMKMSAQSVSCSVLYSSPARSLRSWYEVE